MLTNRQNTHILTILSISKGEIHKRHQYLVDTFCKKYGVNWPREMKLARQLLKARPEFPFWQTLSLGFQLNSLAWFLTEKGQFTLSQHDKKMSLDFPPAKTYDMNDGIVDKPSPAEEKPKTIFDFLQK